MGSLGSRFSLAQDIPPDVGGLILGLANQKNCLKQVEDWLKDYP